MFPIAMTNSQIRFRRPPVILCIERTQQVGEIEQTILVQRMHQTIIRMDASLNGSINGQNNND